LIAPPRSKDQKSPRTDKKRAKSPTPMASFAVHFQDDENPILETPVVKIKSSEIEKEDQKDMMFDFDKGEKLVEPPSEEPPINLDVKKQNTPDKTKEKETKPENEKSEEKKKIRTDAVAEMKRGTAMLKYGRRGFPHFRRFQLSDDMTRLVWYSRKKNVGETSVTIADMKEVLEGQQTEIFKQCTQSSLEKASFSIIYGNKMKTLDLVAKSHEEAKLWAKGLRGLIKANQQGKLHKVAQILVNVDYTDITKPNYHNEEDDQIPITGYNNTELLNIVEVTLEQTKKLYKMIQELMRNPEIQKNKEFNAIKELVSELEQRIDNTDFALAHKTMALQSLKRDIWVLKVDVTVLHEKLEVLSKPKFHLF